MLVDIEKYHSKIKDWYSQTCRFFPDKQLVNSLHAEWLWQDLQFLKDGRMYHVLQVTDLL